MTAFLDGVGIYPIMLHGTLGPLDESLDVIAVLAVAFTLLCFAGYTSLGRKAEQVGVVVEANRSGSGGEPPDRRDRSAS